MKKVVVTEAQTIGAILGGLAVLGQALNAWLFLRLDNAMLRSRAEILRLVEERFLLKEVYIAGLGGQE